MIRARQVQHGFSTIAAIFLLVVLAGLGAFMVTFSNTQHLTSAQDVQGSRAYWAARAGVEWATSIIRNTAACPVDPGPPDVDGFGIAVTCVSQGYAEGAATRTMFRVTVTAASGGAVGTPGRIERNLTAVVEM